MTAISDGDIVVRLIKLPGTIKGFTCPSLDGVYNVYINRNLSLETRNIVLCHEIEHIKNGDFDSCMAIKDIETI